MVDIIQYTINGLLQRFHLCAWLHGPNQRFFNWMLFTNISTRYWLFIPLKSWQSSYFPISSCWETKQEDREEVSLAIVKYKTSESVTLAILRQQHNRLCQSCEHVHKDITKISLCFPFVAFMLLKMSTLLTSSVRRFVHVIISLIRTRTNSIADSRKLRSQEKDRTTFSSHTFHVNVSPIK